jgi:hypothetical protein
MPNEKSQEEKEEEYERDNLEDEYYKTQNEMDSSTDEDD